MSMNAEVASTQSVHHSGWETFAGIMLAIGAVANALFGWGALRDANAWGDYRPIADAAFVGPLEFWGWLFLVWSVVLLIGGWLLFAHKPSGPTTGIVLASISAVAWLITLPSLPLMAVVVLIIDILIIYGLTVARHERG